MTKRCFFATSFIGRYVMYVLGYIYYHKLSRVDELGYHLMSGDNFCYIFYKFLCDDVLGHIYNQELSRSTRVGLRLLCNRFGSIVTNNFYIFYKLSRSHFFSLKLSRRGFFTSHVFFSLSFFCKLS